MKPAWGEGRRGDFDLRLSGKRAAPAAAAVGDRVYIFGGAGDKGINTDVEIITGASGDRPAMESAKSTLAPRWFHTAAAVGDNVFIIGGWGSSGITGTVERYDTRTGKSYSCAPLPIARRALGSAAVGDYIFVVGGSDSRGISFPSLDVYDTKRDKWTSGPQMAVARECSIAFVGGLIIVAGGYDGKTALNICEAYAVDQVRWTRMPPLPVATSANHVAIVQNRLCSFGDYAALDRVLAFDLKRYQWSLASTMPMYQGSRHNAVVAAGNRVYVIGGNVAPSRGGLDLVQVLTVV